MCNSMHQSKISTVEMKMSYLKGADGHEWNGENNETKIRGEV